jgi:murein DD-endopeptidase MepM/ murein hydrolase activator NlpD
VNVWLNEFNKGRRPWVIAAVIAGVIIMIFMQRSRDRSTLSTWQGEQTGSGPGLTGAAIAQGQALKGLFSGAPADADIPWGDPLGGDGQTVVTQGYGVGTHAPAAIWGGLDLAIDSNGDGAPEPGPTSGRPVYATHRGVVTLTPNSWPAGNHLSLQGTRYRSGYAHLMSFAVENGALVERGTLIGYVGSTGQSSGPHLHYDIWEEGVNVNPMGFSVFP